MDNLKNKKIIVTGGAGFIGSNIVYKLIDLDAQVLVVDDLSTGKIENLDEIKDKIEFVNESILNTKKMTEIFRGADAILHQAAIPSVPKSINDPMKSHIANSDGTLSIFISAKEAGVSRVVYASSSSVYGNSLVLPKVEFMQPNPLSPYAIQKLTAELYAGVFWKLFGLETIGLRYFNVFGPRQNPDSEYAAVIPRFIKLINDNKSPQIYGDGEQTRDFTFVENVVQANLSALRTTEGFGGFFNIALGNRISLNDLIEKINKILGKNTKPDYLKERAGDVRDSLADITLAKDVLGYEPKISFDEGLKKTIDWYVNK